MLLELNVRDIALIKEASASFGRGLNILTGETGTGKSVIIGSALLALGAKAKADLIRRGAESAYAELVFEIKDTEKKARLKELGAELEDDGILVISRKLTPQRSLGRINGETVNLGKLRETAELLIDIYGQNEHQSLRDSKKHLELLDAYLHKEAGELLAKTAACFRAYHTAKKNYESFNLNEQERIREADLAAFELDEIDAAAIRDGEEEQLAADYRRLSHAKQVAEALNLADQALDENTVGAALSAVSDALRYDDTLKDIYHQLSDADSILQSAQRDLRDCADSLDLNENTFREVEERLDLIRALEAKYGNSAAEIRAYRERRAEKLAELEDYDNRRQKAKKEADAAKERLLDAAMALREKRKEGAKTLCSRIRTELLDLGFDSVRLELLFTEKAPSENGADEVCFMASLNPGEPEKPLSEAASGGELSRFMLALKTVLAETDDIPTLIFDEIDTGISGRTAQKVSEKLSLIARTHQVICITHLPQIAAMADNHYVIEKAEEDGRNETRIRRLSEEESLEELARLLGGVAITGAVRENAREMKRLANAKKQAIQ